MELFFESHNKEETKRLGALLAPHLVPMDVVLLTGDLGAGKTTFVSGVAEGLGIKDNVISPTFNIMKCYFGGRLPLYHIDAYRLEDQNIEIGLDEYIEGDGACFIEWPKFIEPLIPDERIEIEINHKEENTRTLIFKTDCPRLAHVLEEVKEAFNHD